MEVAGFVTTGSFAVGESVRVVPAAISRTLTVPLIVYVRRRPSGEKVNVGWGGPGSMIEGLPENLSEAFEDVVDALAGHIVHRALEATPAVSVLLSFASRLP